MSITHSGEGAERLVHNLSALRASVYHVPLVEFQSLTPPVVDLTAVNWLVLTSPQGVRSLHSILNGLDVPPGLRWAAVGESTAQAMRRAGLPVHFIPSRATGQSLGAELPCHPADTVLHVTSDQSKEDLAEAVSARAVTYQRLVLYRTVPREPDPAELALLLTSDAVTLASSSAAQHLARLGGLPLPVVVMGQQTARTARDVDFQTVIVAPTPSLAALENAVIQFLSRL